MDKSQKCIQITSNLSKYTVFLNIRDTVRMYSCAVTLPTSKIIFVNSHLSNIVFRKYMYFDKITMKRTKLCILPQTFRNKKLETC